MSRPFSARTLPLLLAGVAACRGGEDLRIQAGGCTLGDEHELASTSGNVDDVVVADVGAAAWVAWSEVAGAFARRIHVATGAPLGPAIVLGARCDAGMAAAAGEGSALVACGRRGDEAKSDPGGVVMLMLAANGDATDVRVAEAFGPVGPDGYGVSLTSAPDARPIVGWQEARGPVSAAWTAWAIGEPTPLSEPRRVSAPAFHASAPTLAWHDGLVVAWAETWLDADGDTAGRIQVRRGDRPDRTIAEIAFADPMPTLRAYGDREGVIAFRDRRPARSRPRVQLAALDADFERAEHVVPAAHANTDGEALAERCGEDTIVVAPRTHSRTERLVSIRRWSRDADEPTGPEQQLYEFGAAFVHADLECGTRGHGLLAIASRPTQVHSRGTIRTLTVTCAPLDARGDGEPDQRGTSRPPEN